MEDNMTRAAGPGGQESTGTYLLTHTGAEVDAAVEGWQTAQAQADATASDIAEGKKAITKDGLVTGTMQSGGTENEIVTITFPELEIIDDNSLVFDCSNNFKLILPVTTEISGFSDCKNLVTVDLYCATMLGLMAFGVCDQLETLIIRTSEVCTMGLMALINTPIMMKRGYVYVPKSLVETYKDATNWTKIADQIRAIEDYPEITGGII